MKRILGLTLFFIVLLSGCVQYSEHLSLDRQGSGRLIFKMGIMDMESILDEDPDDSAVIMEEEDDFGDFPGITVVDATTYAADGFVWSEITLEFESLDALVQALESEEFVTTGEISFAEKDGYLMFKRTLPVLSLESEDDAGMDFAEDMPIEMVEMFFADITWVYEVTFPNTIIESNAQDDDVDLATNTVRWSVLVTDLFSEEMEMWAKIAL